MRHRCLILTGTINAGNDVARRRKEYMSALAFYGIHVPDDMDIYFLENSDYDISDDRDFSKLLSKYRVSVIRMNREKAENKGKGYQEFSMIDRFVQKHSSSYASFAKITGRYIVKNIEKLIDLPCDAITIDRHKKTRVAVTGFFICNMKFYREHILGAYENADDEKLRFIEHVLYDVLKGVEEGGLFPKNPKYTGRSGSYGGSLHRNPYKMMLRNLERILLRTTNKREFLIEY